ncbi:MAG TPA: GGDEF domain-containing protein, partial [Burkholderiaceae bacterium]|nr:GGDEF domain-containing protein [Burkholderiaceae bacterium]
IIDHLASLTGLRDRDTLDVSLAHAMRDLLAPVRVAIYRLVGDQGNERWLTRAALKTGAAAATADPAWVDLESLPRAAERPEWLECLTTAKIIEVRSEGIVTTLFPVMSDTGAVGVIEIQTVRGIGTKSRRLVFGVLRIYRNVQTLLDYSERDTLTGLLNRKIFDDSFYKVASLPLLDGKGDHGGRRHAAGARYWLGVVDIDHFKNVNDRFGHLIGDEVLLLVSRIMREAFRFSDQLYRFGGEEFVVLLLCGDEAGAVTAFERFRKVVGEYAFPQAGRITISIGFTAIEVGDTPSVAFERADRAVYHAKHNGRDQVCNYAELQRRGIVEDDRRVSDVELF